MTLNSLWMLMLRIMKWIWQIIQSQSREHPWAVMAAVYGVARAFGVMIQSGQRGILFRWGRVVKELEPGFHWLVPLMHKARKTPVRSVTLVLPDQKVMTADGLVYKVQVNVVYRVEDATKALTLVDHLESACRAAIPIVVTEIVRKRHQEELVDRDLLDRELKERIDASVARWGLVIEQAGFTSIAPDKSVLRITQLRSKTMERSRALRLIINGGLDPEFALVLIGSDRHPVAKTSRRYHRAIRGTRGAASDHYKPAGVSQNMYRANRTTSAARKSALGRLKPGKPSKPRLTRFS